VAILRKAQKRDNPMDDAFLWRLDAWARDRKIWPEKFPCPYYQDCQDSIRSQVKLDGGKTCLMSYVGKDYGKPIAARSSRLVIAGIDHGWRGDKPTNFKDNQRGMEDVYYGGGEGKNFNAHYSGVIRTAAAIMGRATPSLRAGLRFR
jgi:hypothetical protein